MHRRSGFSIIELLIVISIILIICAIAIPKLLRSRMAANEASAVGMLHTFNTAEVTYESTYPTKGFSATAASLGTGGSVSCTPVSDHACLIDSFMELAFDGTGTKAGYKFKYGAGDGVPIQTYTIAAKPAQPQVTGQRNFFMDESGVIRANDGSSEPKVTDNPLQ